jgi:MoxR-like ATPase
VFLDELLNANSAILNSLLTALNERMFRRGKESRPLKALMFVSASNRLPEDDALKALFDRFLLRVHCDNVAAEQLPAVLEAGWKLGDNTPPPSSLHFDDVQSLQELLPRVDLAGVRTEYGELIHRIRHAGIPVSDRRAVKLQRLVVGSALLCGRLGAKLSDLWVLKYIWDTEEQQEVLGALVQKVLEKAEPDEADHVRARPGAGPDPENLARDLDYVEEQIKTDANGQSGYLRDRLSLLEGRCQWVSDRGKREFLAKRVADLWQRLKPISH